jgi:rod shape-determining protein MreD
VAAIFYWSIYRPKMLPKSFMVLLGIFQDLLYFNPVGISAITNLAAQSVMLSQRKIFIKEPFWVLWLGFGLFCFGTSIFKWSALSLLRGELINPTNAMMQFLLSLASYPIMHSTLGVIHSFLPKSREDNA